MNGAARHILATILIVAPWLPGCSTIRSGHPICPSIEGLEQVPVPGEILEDLPKPYGGLLYGSGGVSDGYTADVDGIEFWIGVERLSKRKYRVDYVCTRDPMFVTPEGAKCGDILASVFDRTTSQLVNARGMSAYLSLPSGWCAAFRNFEFDASGEIVAIEVTGASEIIYFFRR